MNDATERTVREDTMASRSAQSLRQAILSLQLAPGTRLVEREMVQRLGVSRTGVRAALQSLEAEGLVVRGQRGVFAVARVSPQEARQIYEVRAALEPAMARLFVARATPDQAAALGAAVARAEAAAESLDGREYVEAFRTFYTVLLVGSGNLIAKRILDTLEARITYLRYLTTEQAPQARQLRTVALLRGVFEAVKQRAPDRAARRCEAFVRRSARFALDVLAKKP
ncbi:MAG: GntR family transcriptional regulator [Alphaproteobacteria bacterium]|nr:GntR family transcriptional regulator [Alphaproteobacteria bacterium]MBV9019042.1 GntR family transcriptional regulator [Alphaproteobacteria bacterium]MBV9152024.1 GntR family transcriptional regulator [Alphaproteobacteria bacterium]